MGGSIVPKNLMKEARQGKSKRGRGEKERGMKRDTLKVRGKGKEIKERLNNILFHSRI